MAEKPTIKPPSPELWDHYAEAYGANLARLAGGPYALLLNAAEVRSGCKLVDLGCGPGHLSSEALRRGAEVVGVDFSEKMLDLARYNAADAEMRFGDAASLPVDRRWADAVIANFVLHLLPDPIAAILDSTRIMASGGTFAATVWRPHEENPAIGLFYAAMKQCGLEVPDATQAGPPLWDRDHFTRALARARLDSTEVRNVEWIMRVRPDEWWAAMVRGGPVTGAILTSLDQPTHDKVRSAFLTLMARLPKEDDEVLLPARAILGTGRVVR